MMEPEANQPRARTGPTRRVKILGTGLLAVVAITILVILASTDYTDYTPRARVSEGLLLAVSLRTEITERIRAGTPPQSAGAGLTITRGGAVKGGTVSENGSIYVVFENPPAVLTMKITNFDPATRQVKWQCLGYPAKVMPASCRE